MRSVRRPFIVCVLVGLAAVSSPVHAHDQEEGYSWTNDPANAQILEDCTDILPHSASSYMSDRRLSRELSATATRIEVTSTDAVVTEFVVSATNWVFHAEQPDSLAHAERTAAGVPPTGLLLRMGFERKDARNGLPVTFQVQVFGDDGRSLEVLEFSIPLFPVKDGELASYSTGVVCREASEATSGVSSTPSVEEDTPDTEGAENDELASPGGVSGGFPAGKALVGIVTILMASALLWVLRRRRL
jgi:hypothetical protein